MLKIGAGVMTTKKKKTKKKTKKKKASTEVISQLTDGITDIAEVTITIPLSEVTRNIHTRMFIQTKLSLPQLQNMKQLGQIFKANAYYYNDKYVKNVWFVKKTRITNSPKEKSMTLTLLPFNDSSLQEAQTLKQATQKKNKTANTKTTKTEISGDKFLKSIVKKAIGTKTSKEAQAKAIHKYYTRNHVYQYKETDVREQYKRGFKTLWNQNAHSCGPGAATLYYMLKSIGLDPQIVHGHKHFWIQVEINGTTYYCDQSGQSGKHCTRTMGTSTSSKTVWGGATGGSIVMGG